MYNRLEFCKGIVKYIIQIWKDDLLYIYMYLIKTIKKRIMTICLFTQNK